MHGVVNIDNPIIALQERASSDSLFRSVSFTLIFASRCFCSLKGYCLYIMARLGDPCPLSKY